MPLELYDRVSLDGIRRTRDGYLAASVRAARAGIQLYSGAEVGMPDRSIVRVYRPETEVFSKDSLASYAHRPVTLDHPDALVTADNWKDYAVGQTGDEVARDGEFVRIPMVAMDKRAIDAIDAGKRELSMGYTCDLAFEPGKTTDGQEYDLVQSNIRINHLAVVGAARGGSKLRIGDDTRTGDDPMNLKKITFDGITIDVTDAGAEVIAKLQKQLADAETARTTAETKIAADATAHKTAVDAKDAEVATLKKQLADAAITPAKIRDAAKQYSASVAQAKAIAPAVKIDDGMDTAAIQKAVVTAKMGDLAKDWNEAQIETSFRTLAAGLPKGALQDAHDPLRDALRTGVTTTGDSNDGASKAHAKMVDRMTNSWKPQAAA